jgi:hypothetical protein
VLEEEEQGGAEQDKQQRRINRKRKDDIRMAKSVKKEGDVYRENRIDWQRNKRG